MVWFSNVEISSCNYVSSSSIFYFCRLWGLAPYTIRNNVGNFTLKLSLLWIIYSYFLGVLLVYTSIHALIVHTINLTLLKGEYVLHFGSVLGNVVTIVLLFGAPFRTTKLYLYIKCINQIDSVFQAKDSKRAKYVSIGALSILFSAITIQVCLSLYFMGVRNLDYVLEFIPDNIQHTYMASVFECQYAHMVYCIERRITTINNCLNLNETSRIQEQITKLYSRPKINKVDRLETKLQMQFGNNYGLKLAKFYSLLCDSVDSINKLFDYTIVVLILNCLLRITVSMYFLIFMILQRFALGSIVTQVFWVLFDLSRLLVLLEPCNRCLRKINYTNVTVSKILAVTNISNNNNLKEQITIFSRHLKHRKLKFSVGGFAVFNYKFLTSFMSAVTTYLVIVIQFNQSFNRS